MITTQKTVAAGVLAAVALAGGSIAAFGDSPSGPAAPQPVAVLGAVDPTSDGAQASDVASGLSAGTGIGPADRAVLAKRTNGRKVWTSKASEGECVTQMPAEAVGPGGTCYTRQQIAAGEAWQVTGSSDKGYALMAVVSAKVKKVDVQFADGSTSTVTPGQDGLVYAESSANISAYSFISGSQLKTVKASGFDG